MVEARKTLLLPGEGCYKVAKCSPAQMATGRLVRGQGIVRHLPRYSERRVTKSPTETDWCCHPISAGFSIFRESLLRPRPDLNCEHGVRRFRYHRHRSLPLSTASRHQRCARRANDSETTSAGHDLNSRSGGPSTAAAMVDPQLPISREIAMIAMARPSRDGTGGIAAHGALHSLIKSHQVGASRSGLRPVPWLERVSSPSDCSTSTVGSGCRDPIS